MDHFVRQMHPTKRLQGCWGSVWPSWLSAMSRAGPGTDGVNFCTCIPVVRAVTDIALDSCVAQAPTSPHQTSKPSIIVRAVGYTGEYTSCKTASPEEEPRVWGQGRRPNATIESSRESSGLVDQIDFCPVALIAQSGLGEQLPAATPQFSFTQVCFSSQRVHQVKDADEPNETTG